MSSEDWVPSGTQVDRPNVARVYDYYLGGYHNFEVDRRLADRVLEVCPYIRTSAWANRAFLRRVVRFLAERGIDQFLDIGSGIPTVGNVHEVAEMVNPAVHVVYVDIEPVAVAHSRAMLKGNPRVTAIQADARKPEEILAHPEVKALLDLSRPLAVLFVAVLQWVVNDDEAQHAVSTLRDAACPGSYIALAHTTAQGAPADLLELLGRLSSSTEIPIRYRTHEECLRLLEGLALVEPGLVYVPLWRPEGKDDPFFDQPERSMNWGAVGCKL